MSTYFSQEKAKLYKTARALVSCVGVKAGDFVAVRHYGQDGNGKNWFYVSTKDYPYPSFESPVLPEDHLERFCL